MEQAKDIQEKRPQPLPEKNKRAVFLCLKIEKIIAVIHILTEGMVADEPLRKKLRQTALDLFSGTHSLLASEVSLSFNERNRLAGKVDQLISLLTAIALLGNSSELLAILREQLGLVRELILDGQFSGLYRMVMPKDFFPNKEDGITERREEMQGFDKGQYIRHKGHLDKGQIISPTKILMRSRGTPEEVMGTIGKKTEGERVQKILGSMEKEREYGIKELATSLSGVGEKTVQRELLSMVQNGLLSKHGERRWSRYVRVS